MSSASLKLIKDLDDFKFIYYWACPHSGQVSPNLPTLLHASEWLAEYQAKKYQNTERRKSTTDRRRRAYKSSSPSMELIYSRRINPEGRRVTDKLPTVDLDMTPDKCREARDQFIN
ncbi:hypothetical protein [Neptuniibacter marinus]|uniref:hypothetical protein n=1 Tax=Neptuniibacter marinus TaxID=1806670 RepID=UPI00082CE9FF|nr:hypothetical protein [Neptuniibacter marinus]